MSETPRTHYRKVFKSNHLGVADLEECLEAGHNLIFTIKHVKQEFGTVVAGKKVDGNFAYFVENIKPLKLNAGACATMKKLTGSYIIEDWGNRAVQLYIDPNAKFAGETVGGVRIHPNPVVLQKRVLVPEDVKQWNKAIVAFEKYGNLVKVLQRFEISQDHQQLIMRQANNV